MDGFFRRLFGSRTFVSFEDRSSIDYLNREAIVYRDSGGRQMEIPWYFDNRVSGGRVVYLNDIALWNAPHDRERLSSQENTDIADKIREYARRRKVHLRIENGRA